MIQNLSREGQNVGRNDCAIEICSVPCGTAEALAGISATDVMCLTAQYCFGYSFNISFVLVGTALKIALASTSLKMSLILIG